ncbi:RNA-directed DNA polymerase, eukaryota, Reverse transcriptase zinc-binding domain protein [Artemisia annua]|uniref:RNA-directed DNA polymerase, eukaryota, Reverse transcriptase zinc-binding domain protein n=1 Tax=Artemisia annua TaxID=35608 RepID=A0A2U1M079_ARTAN|nr:RNA-directed DNA polymerase, eukaryota, Reverse transcriptase zinc-binding domain protein [Artemisia annua]
MEKDNTNKASLNTGNSNASSGPKSNLFDNAPILKSILKKSGTSSTKSALNVSTVGRQGEANEGLKTSELSAKLKHIDGTIVGRDGRVLKPQRGVKFVDYVDVLPTDQNMENVTSNVEVLGNEKNTMDDSSQVSSGERHENVNLVAGPTYSNQHVEGASVIDIAMREFKECVVVIEVFDVNRSGLQFTWNQKPRGTDGKLKKIDRIMANLACMDAFIGAHAIFQPYRISDHSPAILTIPTYHKFTPKPFKFYNIIVQNSQFKGKVKEFWDMDVSGFHMYKVVTGFLVDKADLELSNGSTKVATRSNLTQVVVYAYPFVVYCLRFFCHATKSHIHFHKVEGCGFVRINVTDDEVLEPETFWLSCCQEVAAMILKILCLDDYLAQVY